MSKDYTTMRVFIFLIIFGFSTTEMIAQQHLSKVSFSNSSSEKQRKMRGGLLKIGIGISYLNVDNAEPKFRFHAGLAPTFPLNGQSYIKPEIAISLKGGKALYNGSYFDGHVTYRTTYLEFPVMFGFKPINKTAFEFGGYGAILLGGSFDFNGTFFSGYGTFTGDELNDFDYGLAGGIVFSGKRLKLGIRYYYSIHEVAATSTARTFLGNATNHTIQIYFQRSALRERFGTAR